jgi:hypothetical protein
MEEHACMHGVLIRIQNQMTMVKVMAGGGIQQQQQQQQTTTFPHRDIYAPRGLRCAHGDANPRKKQQHPSCLEQFFDNLIIGDLCDIHAAIVQSSQHVDLYRPYI